MLEMSPFKALLADTMVKKTSQFKTERLKVVTGASHIAYYTIKSDIGQCKERNGPQEKIYY